MPHTLERSTEARNPRTRDLDLWPSERIVDAVLAEDALAVAAARAAVPALAQLVEAALERRAAGGRVHYFGAGASGRLALLDATEATPTFGVEPGYFVPHFPGGVPAFMDSTLDYEDAGALGHDDAAAVAANDVAIGITASGGTAYVLGALERARAAGALTGLITSNPESASSGLADVIVVADTGAEAVTGSTRLKAGTATKVLLNAFSSALMVRAGRTYSNLMVDLVATNAKLHDRAVTVLVSATGRPVTECADALASCAGDLPVALVALLSGRSPGDARGALERSGSVRGALTELGA